MKSLTERLSRATLFAVLAASLLVGGSAGLSLAKEKNPSKVPAEAKEASTMTSSNQPKPEAKHHKEKKHSKSKKGETVSPESTSPTK